MQKSVMTGKVSAGSTRSEFKRVRTVKHTAEPDIPLRNTGLEPMSLTARSTCSEFKKMMRVKQESQPDMSNGKIHV